MFLENGDDGFPYVTPWIVEMQLDDDGYYHGEIVDDGDTIVHVKHGLIHNDFGPAIVSANGLTQIYYRNGLKHRPDGAAVKTTQVDDYDPGDEDSEIKYEYWLNGKQVDELTIWLMKRQVIFA